MFKYFKILVVLVSLLSLSLAVMGYTTQFADEGGTKRLHWKNAPIPISLSNSLIKQNLNIKADSDVTGAVQRSLEAWEKAANIKFELVSSDQQSVSPSGKFGDGISLITIAQTSENLILFGSDTEAVSAKTRIFYNGRGLITEADIVLNPYQQFSTDGSIGTFDLQSTLTHEIGHLLGLEHSTILGSTMHAHQAKNGIYNLPSFSSRTLAEDDIAGIRSLYGAKSADEDCCGTINGRILSGNSKNVKSTQVWAEESETGRVVAGVLTGEDGSFRLDGLTSGEYHLYAQDFSERKYATEDFGKIEVTKGRTSEFSGKTKNNSKDFDVRYIGSNGQISELAVPLNVGKSHVIYIGGKNLDVDNIIIGFSSPYFSVTPLSITKQDYGSDISVVSFEVNVNLETPVGEYSFYVQNKNANKVFFTGGLTVESFVNSSSSHFLLDNNLK